MRLTVSIVLMTQVFAQAAFAAPSRTEVGVPPSHDIDQRPNGVGDKNAPADAMRAWTPDGATQVVIELTAAEGSVVRNITLYGDAGVTPEELAMMKRSLERTGLYVVVSPDAGPGAALELHRSSELQMVAVLRNREGEPLWSAAVNWPEAATAPALAENEEHHAKVTRYGRERLIVRVGVLGAAPPSTIYFGGYSQPYGFADPSWGWGNGMMGGTPPPGNKHADWVVVRGAADVIDEVEFAHLIGNENLANRIREKRNKPKLWWALSFGAGAVGGLTSGFLLYGDKHSDDTRAIGFSLLGVGVA
ncbi:MAG: hypothetical protein H7Z43_03750, partial [Clostridia bacterium]|nr:hypothetical protein [Deltaproteobacteria bacterium]